MNVAVMHSKGTLNDVVCGNVFVGGNLFVCDNDVECGNEVVFDDDDNSSLDLCMIRENSFSFNSQKDGQNVTPNSTKRWTSSMQINFSIFFQ
jgi:hypothetical protein